jgi:O-antigen ligase
MTLHTVDSKLSSIIHSKGFSWFMLTSLFGYAIFKYASRTYGDVFQTFLVAGSFLALYLERKIIFKDKMLICLFLALVIQVLSWINATIYIPQLAQARPNFSYLGNMFFFIFIAYWLRGQIRSVYLLWFSMLIGFVISFYLHSNNFTQEIIDGLNGARINFNINNAQHSALWAGIAFILLSYFSIKFIYLSITSNKVKKYICISFILLLINAFFAFIIFATQTRQVFLGLVITCIFAPIAYAFLQKYKPSLKLVLPLIVTSIVVLFTLSNISTLENRTAQDTSTYKALLTGNMENIPYDSSGTRINIWYEALGWIQDRPILGSGQDVRDDVVSLSKRIPDNIRTSINHLHNSFIEITLSYGIIGLALILFTFYWLLHSTSKFVPLGQFNEIRLIALLFLIYWFVVNNFESFLFSTTGLLVHNIMFGSIYTFYLTNNLNKDND